jgi:hypothetical protein
MKTWKKQHFILCVPVLENVLVTHKNCEILEKHLSHSSIALRRNYKREISQI